MAPRKPQNTDTPPEEQKPNDGVGQVDEQVNPAQGELQQTVDKAEEKGYLGVETDPTPNANYTVGGVTSGAPTPETEKGQG